MEINFKNSSSVSQVDDRNLVNVGLYATALTIGMLCSVFGNALTLVAIGLHKPLRTKTSCFIASLATADMLNGCTTFVQMLASTIYGRWPFTDGLCTFYGSLTALFCIASINTLAFIAIDRYFAIVDPLRYRIKVTPKFVTICLTYTWVQGIWLATMPIFGWGHIQYVTNLHVCAESLETLSYVLFGTIYNLGIPVSIIIFCYSRIFKVARHQSRKVAKQTVQLADADRLQAGQKIIKKETKAAIVLLIVIGTFLICWSPYSLTMLCYAFAKSNCPIPGEYHMFSILLAMTNSAMNPMLYVFLNRQMRQAYIDILRFPFKRDENGHAFSFSDT